MSVENLGDIAKSFTYSFSLFPAVLMTFCVVGGLVLCIRGILKLKAHTDSKGQIKLSEAFLYIGAGTALLCFPAVLTVGKEVMGVGETNAKDVLKYVEKPEPKY